MYEYQSTDKQISAENSVLSAMTSDRSWRSHAKSTSIVLACIQSLLEIVEGGVKYEMNLYRS